MANIYTTWVKARGPKWCRDALVKIHFPDGKEFDFDTLIPMPEILLDTEASDRVDDALIFVGRGDLTRFKRTTHNIPPGTKASEVLEMAQKYLEIYRQTGFINWYNWAVANWGTKWNACNTKILRNGTEYLEFEFETAWVPPVRVLEKMIEEWPNLKFQIKGRDEGMRRWSTLHEEDK